MRKITQEAVEAFLSFHTYSKDNTLVLLYGTEKEPHAQMMLHGNVISRNKNGKLSICDAGWATNTTKERLNGLPNVSIKQKAGTWYLNGKEWNGEWTTI